MRTFLSVKILSKRSMEEKVEKQLNSILNFKKMLKYEKNLNF